MSSAFRADLHLHTDASDGLLSPRAVVERAAQAGMSIIAITDHDTVSGVEEAMRAGAQCGIRVLPGIELSVGGSQEVHLLGYGIDSKSEAVVAQLSMMLRERRERMLCMLEALRGMDIQIAPEETGPEGLHFMGRLHLALAMVNHGYVKSVKEAFDRYIGAGKPAYVPRKHISVPEGIEMLCAWKGVVSLAHPGRLSIDWQAITARLPGWIERGLAGIEAYHSSHSAPVAQSFERLARARGLLVTGGSDFHGEKRDGVRIGEHLAHWQTVEADINALIGRMPQAEHDR